MSNVTEAACLTTQDECEHASVFESDGVIYPGDVHVVVKGRGSEAVQRAIAKGHEQIAILFKSRRDHLRLHAIHERVVANEVQSILDEILEEILERLGSFGIAQNLRASDANYLVNSDKLANAMQQRVTPLLADAGVSAAERYVAMTERMAERLLRGRIRKSSPPPGVFGIGDTGDVLIDMPLNAKFGITDGIYDTFSQSYWYNNFAQTTKLGVSEAIAHNLSVKTGATLKDHANSIRDLPEMGWKRSMLVARTEVNMAMNSGHNEIQELLEDDADSPVDGRKWLSIIDGDTRSAHRAANGQEVRIVGETGYVLKPDGKTVLGRGRLFLLTSRKSGTEHAKYPGDGNLSAGQRINCRCTMIPTFGELDEIPEVMQEIKEENKTPIWEDPQQQPMTQLPLPLSTHVPQPPKYPIPSTGIPKSAPKWVSDQKTYEQWREAAEVRRQRYLERLRTGTAEKRPARKKPKAGGQVAAVFPDSLDDLVEVERLGGSTGARLMEDANGNRYVLKRGLDAGHIREEIAAERLYRSLGVAIPESRIYGSPEAPIKLSRFLRDPKEIGGLEGQARKRAMKEAKEDFAADALLGNWDAVGMSLDNMMVEKGGQLYRIDVGGSLRYRAQGGLKGGWSDKRIGELRTMRGLDGHGSSSAAQVFDGMTHEEVYKSAERILARKKEFMRELRAIKKDMGGDFDELERIMKARFKALEDYTIASRELKAADFIDDYREQFCEMQAKMSEAGVFDSLPKKLVRSSRHSIVDENGASFDRLRDGQGYRKSVQEFCEANGLPHDVLVKYYNGQSGSSWSNAPLSAKYWVTGKTKKNRSKYYWGRNKDEGRPQYGWTVGNVAGGNERIVDDVYTVNHVMFYRFCKDVEFDGNYRDKGVLSLGRTESKSVIRLKKLKIGELKAYKIGPIESTSIHETVTVGGSELVYFEVPHTRVFGHYYVQKEVGSPGGLLLGDTENEVLAMLDGVKGLYDGSTRSMEELLPLHEWQAKIKQ